MRTIIQTVPRVLSFIYSFKSSRIITLLSVITTLIFTIGTGWVEGAGPASIISIMGREIPAIFIILMFNTVFLFATLGVVMITFQFCEFLLFGHFSHAVIGGYRNRYELIAAYLIGTLVFVIPIGTGYVSFYFWMSPGFKPFFFAVCNSIAYFYTIVLMTTAILNINSLKKYALVLLVMIFFVIPATINTVLPMIPDTNIFYSMVIGSLRTLHSVLNVHQSLSRNIDFILQSSFVNTDTILKSVLLLIPYVGIIVFHFKRKEFA